MYESKLGLPIIKGQKERPSDKKRDAFFNLEYLFFDSDSEVNEDMKNSFQVNTSNSILNRSASHNDFLMTSADKSAIKNYTFWNNKQKSIQSKQTAARILAKIAINTTI